MINELIDIKDKTSLISYFKEKEPELPHLEELYNNYLDFSMKNKKIVLTMEDDIYLGKLMYVCLNAEDKNTNKKLIETKKKTEAILVYSCKPAISIYAKKYVSVNGMKWDDFEQIGAIGAMEAAERYDYSLGFRFMTYANIRIERKIGEAARKSRQVKLPNHIISKLYKINKKRELLEEELGRNPSLEELSRALKISIEDILLCDKYLYNTTSIDDQATDGNSTIKDLLVSEEDLEEKVCDDTLKISLKQAISLLSEREIEVLTLRYGLNGEKEKTLDEIGLVLGVTKERVRQIEAKALKGLRHPSRAKFLVDYL